MLCATVLDQARLLLGAEDGLYIANLVDNSVEKVLDMKWVDIIWIQS